MQARFFTKVSAGARIAGHLAPLATEPQEASAAAQWRDDLAKQMSAAQISRAKDRVRTWLAAGTPPASCTAGSNRIRFVITVEDAPLPAEFPHDSVQVTVASFYNEAP